MARKKNVVEEKDYAALIQASEKLIETMTEDLKAEKANLKQLRKDKECYDKMIEDQKREREIREVTELILDSGKSLDEIKALLKN